MGLISRANTAAFLDPNLLSQRLEELYAGSKPNAPGRKDDRQGPAPPPGGVGGAGGERGAASVAAGIDPAGVNPPVHRFGAARQAYMGAIKKRVSTM